MSKSDKRLIKELHKNMPTSKCGKSDSRLDRFDGNNDIAIKKAPAPDQDAKQQLAMKLIEDLYTNVDEDKDAYISPDRMDRFDGSMDEVVDEISQKDTDAAKSS